MPPYDYDYLIGAARGGDQRAKLLLDYLAANKRVNSFINSGSYQYSPVIEDVTVDDDVNDVDIDSGNVDDIYNDIRKDINGQGSRNDWMSSALAVGNGLTSIFNTSKNMANIADTSQQQNMIQDLGNIGRTQYSNWEQIGMDYDRFNNLQPNLSFDAIRGGSTKERVGGVLSNTATGAMTGLQVGGPWGALAGGVIGAGAGIGSWLVGDKDAETELKDLRLKRYLAQDKAMSNLVSGIDNYSNYQFKNGIGTMKKNGGPIQRKRTPIKAEKVKGGTKIRIKR